MLTDKQTLILTGIIAMGFSISGIFGILDNLAIAITLFLLLGVFLIHFYVQIRQPEEEEEEEDPQP